MPKKSVIAKLNRVITWIGALSGAVNLVLTCVLIGVWQWNGNAWETCGAVVLTTLILTAAPLVAEIRYDGSDMEPIIVPSLEVKRFVRAVTAGLFLLAFVGVYVELTDKANESSGVDGGILVLSLFLSWVCLTCYVYGIRVLYSEKVLAVSRNPRFLFQRDRLREYLEEKRKERQSIESGGGKDAP